MRILFTVISSAALLLVIAFIAEWFGTHRPNPVEEVTPQCGDQTHSRDATLPSGLKVMTWNIQYLAGKGYVFFYDLASFSGPDDRPRPESLVTTLEGVSARIRNESPDIVLLQEVDEGARRTGGQNQSALLQAKLLGLYPCASEAFYWKSIFVPHPRVMGSVGMKLVTLSRYPIERAWRFQLPQKPADFVTGLLQIQRAVLESRIALPDGRRVHVLNTHLEAFAQGSDTMQKQVQWLESRLATLDQEGTPWILGGDLNMLPPGPAYTDLQEAQKFYYTPTSPIEPLFQKYSVIPSSEEVSASDRSRWWTHFPNDPSVGRPDRTIDYIFYSKEFHKTGSRVINDSETLKLSDHLPVLGEWKYNGP